MILGRSVHTAKMLCEQIFTVEVIVVEGAIVVGIGCWRAKIATPVAKLDVLGADVSLPLVLRRESGIASVVG